MKNKSSYVVLGVIVLGIILVIAVNNSGQFFSAAFNNIRVTQTKKPIANQLSIADKPLKGLVSIAHGENGDGTAHNVLKIETEEGRFQLLPFKTTEIDPKIIGQVVQFSDLKNPKAYKIINANETFKLDEKPNFDVSGVNLPITLPPPKNPKVLVVNAYWNTIPAPNHVLDSKVKSFLDTKGIEYFKKNSGGNVTVDFDYFDKEIAINSNISGFISEEIAPYLEKYMDLNTYNYYIFILYKKTTDATSKDPEECQGHSTLGRVKVKSNDVTSTAVWTIATEDVLAPCINTEPQILLHELGHQLGLGHGSLATNGPIHSNIYKKSYDETTAGNEDCLGLEVSNPSVINLTEGYYYPAISCLLEYGDDTLMGYTNNPKWNLHKLSTTERKMLGEDIKSQTVKSSGTYTLSSVKQSGENDELSVLIGSMGAYAVEYRNDDKQEIVIRYVPSPTVKKFLFKNGLHYGDTYRMRDFYNYSLEPGKSFTDKFKKLTITYVKPLSLPNSPKGRGNTLAQVKVTFE